jgi:hypothetical protein
MSAQTVRVLGSVPDLECRPAQPGEQRLHDVQPHWSQSANAAWLEAAVRERAVFRVVSTPVDGSVLAWELDCLRSVGYRPIGGHWLPPRWWMDRATYRRVVAAIVGGACGETPVFGPKVRDELGPLLLLWPHVVLWPTARTLSRHSLVRCRAVPVHPLGVVAAPTWADGALRSPAEFLWHDVDHARFKVREDLLARGIEVPDAYRDGTTWDAATGRHRAFVTAARPHVGAWTWQQAGQRGAFVRAMVAAAERQPDRELATAIDWLVFELVHEKSLPLVAAVLAAALADDRHVAKLAGKAAAGFYAGDPPSPGVLARLDAARGWLRSWCEASR